MLSDLRNSADYSLRQWFRWQRRGLRIRNEPKDRLFARLPEGPRQVAESVAARLLADYHLQTLYNNSRAETYRENLFYLEMLERAVATARPPWPQTIRAADIGPSSWFYVHALHALLQWWECPSGRRVNLSGYEADAYRVYVDFHSRFDHAQAHLQGLNGVRYLPEPFARQPAAFDFVTMLFPFVSAKDHLQWGLPRALFAPDQLLADAWHSLKPGGLLVIVNQGEDEHQAEREMLAAAGIKPLAAFRHASTLYQYGLPRCGLVARRDE
jgi:SAM-dependent methyltransferase